MRRPTRTIALSATAAGLIGALGAPLAAVAVPAPASQGDGERTASAPSLRGSDPDLLFVEDFENGVTTTPIMLDQYVGANGESYTADPAWIDAAQCNGIIISADSSNMAACSNNPQLKALGNVLGQITGEDPKSNHVVSAWTESRNLPANAVQIESRDEFSLGASGRFVSFGVSAAAGACVGFAHPLLNFLLVDGEVERPVSGRALNPCTDPRSKSYSSGGAAYKGGEFVSNGGVLFSGETLRWRLRNGQSSSNGNDAAIDRVTIVDSTPILANEFDGTPIVGDTARMTVRVVNTSEHGSKPGWSFSEKLPDGLTVAADPSLATTCANPTTGIEGGGSEVSVGGDLAVDSEDCTVSFDVTATKPGTYTIDQSHVTDAVGLDMPTTASVTFVPEQNDLAVSERGVLTGGNGDDVADLGEEISFVTRIENQGNVLVRDIEVSGNQGENACATAPLAPSEVTECATAPRPVTQRDVDAGAIADNVHVSATSRLGQAVNGSASATVAATPSAAAAALAIAPKGDARPSVGEKIRLEAHVQNTGNVSIRDLAVQIDGHPDMVVACDVSSLAPGASIECAVTGTYTVTQADVDAGSVGFTATLSGVDTAGNAVTAATQATQETVVQAPAVGVTLSPTLNAAGTAPAAGDEIALVVSVENTGNVTLSDVAGAIADRDGFVAECPAGPLAPGASIDCTLPSYTLTQDDIDNGEVLFDADVSATGPKRQDVAGADSATVTVDRQHGVVAVTTAALQDTEGAPMAGEKVTLEVAVRNSGNVTLRNLQAEVDGRNPDVACADGALAPGAEASCTIGDYTLTQQDIDSGAISFEVTVTAAAPGGRTAAASDSASVELVRAPSIGMTATSVLDANEHEVPLAGDTATVAMTIRNTGNVTVTGVRGQVADRDGLTVACPSDELAPGTSVECTVSEYTLTQTDVDRGAVRFDVTAAATGANRERVTSAADTTLTIVRAPAIRTAATADLDDVDRDMSMAGDTATVRLSIVNSGNVTVRNLTGAVTGRDGMVVTCGTESLAPGKSGDCALSQYELSQGDIDAGTVGFDIQAGATGANGQEVTAAAKTGVNIVRVAGVDVTVIGHLAASEHDVPQAGDRVTVVVRGVNTGNTTLTGTRAEIIELADLPVECAADGVAPGEQIDCTVPEYVLTQGDIDHGQVTIAAVLDATGAGDDTVSDRDEVRVGLTAKSVLDVTAEPMVQDSTGAMVVLAKDRVLRPGDKVWVRYQVANTGNLAVNAVQHMDDMSAMTVAEPILQPGERTTAMTTDAHTVTDAEAAKGTVVLLGQVKGQVTRADGDTVEEPGTATTGQTSTDAGTENTITTTAAPAAPSAEQSGAEKLQQLRKPVWVFSTEVQTTIKAEPAPIELAFTGTEITQIAVPASIVALLGGLVLLLWSRRRKQDGEGRHRA